MATADDEARFRRALDLLDLAASDEGPAPMNASDDRRTAALVAGAGALAFIAVQLARVADALEARPHG